jgi:ankyrin repeat protein
MKPSTAVFAWALFSSFGVMTDGFAANGFGMSGFSGGGGGMVVDGPASFESAETNPVETLANSLRVASREGRIKEVQWLLSEGADPNRSGEFGETALMNAARYGQAQVVDLLLEHHAEVNARDSNDHTALHASAKNCAPKIGAKLIAHGADVNWIDSEGKNALIIAADNGCVDLVQSLLRVRGIKLDQKDGNASTALDYALTEAQTEVGGRYTDIVKMLRKAGAKTSQWQVPISSGADSPSTDTQRIP